MRRIYAIRWYPTKETDKMQRTTLVNIDTNTNDVSINGKRAVNLFVSSCGNLKKNTIIWIKELDEEGNQIGEDIVPAEDGIIPEVRA